jgi:hypothetical protein
MSSNLYPSLISMLPSLVGDFDIDMQLHTLVETWIQFFKVYHEALEEQHMKLKICKRLIILWKT